ncbi:Spy/CpxP family protein refolding chaperone [Marinobacterium jannaschii]|uniref:Spy/CpxP family protein refolding chaperone n=1 Tax=Marinobacterium jannaschii TaxID=64970 RepID=UPI0004823ACD|nr:Spy/CpxP family protein refolding chaperone [Marinobacterium jannaschii]
MRKFIIVTASILTLGIAGTAIADGMRYFDRMAEKLDLTTEQRDQVKELMSANKEQMQTLHKEHKESRQAFYQLNPNDANYAAEVERYAEQAARHAGEMVKMRASQREEMSKLLTEEQMTKLASMREKWQSKDGGFGAKGKHHKGKYCH